MGKKAMGDEASVPTSLLMGGVMLLTVSSQPMSFWAGYCDNLLATHDVLPLPPEEENSGRSAGPLHLC